ncbi:Leucine-rich repeat protein kinase family protein [Prunus dulcis]|uniref:Leucine-rich repeat protein kinase family protein n=1 Tax=Prunus dulcis TaxID=3755 RepID=A0A4Y1QZW2_PRUDU|nr:Leucine-rich repeat protein kinase family protein [Prunus dulcis]
MNTTRFTSKPQKASTTQKAKVEKDPKFPTNPQKFLTLSLKPNMHFTFSILLLLLFPSLCFSSLTELPALMAMKASLDPQNQFLTSWTPHSEPCRPCDQYLSSREGSLGPNTPAVGGLKSLTGLYLHFNALSGKIPKEIARLNQLSDLYLNVNNLSGGIPREIGNMPNLQVLQLCYNKLTGGLPTQLGDLKRLSVLAVQSNQLTGAIPASLGELGTLTRLDLSFNSFFGPIPARLAHAPMLQVLDVRSNSLSGNIPLALKRLNGGFQYENNPSLCGVGFSGLKVCTATTTRNPNKPQPFEPGNFSAKNLPDSPTAKEIPESANLESNCSQTHCSRASKSQQIGIVFGLYLVSLSSHGIVAKNRKLGVLWTLRIAGLVLTRQRNILTGVDPLAKGSAGYSQEVLESFMFNLEEVERATQSFSEGNLLRKSNFSAIYKGILRDGSVVAINCISKTSCKPDEAEFLKGLKILPSLKHENLVRLRGFCCSKGRGEWFLIYDFVPNESLLQYLDIKVGSGEVLEWSTRVSIITGIAKGIGYLHGSMGNKPAIVHQTISAEKVLIDSHYNPLLSDSGLHKLLADDIVFSMLKASAAMGYLAPEYTITGRFTAKSDIYAFGMIVFQILSGKRKITQVNRQGAEAGRFEDFIDANLEGNFSESEATKLGRLALLCTQESPSYRPSIENVVKELNFFHLNLDTHGSNFIALAKKKERELRVPVNAVVHSTERVQSTQVLLLRKRPDA